MNFSHFFKILNKLEQIPHKQNKTSGRVEQAAEKLLPHIRHNRQRLDNPVVGPSSRRPTHLVDHNAGSPHLARHQHIALLSRAVDRHDYNANGHAHTNSTTAATASKQRTNRPRDSSSRERLRRSRRPTRQARRTQRQGHLSGQGLARALLQQRRRS